MALTRFLAILIKIVTKQCVEIMTEESRNLILATICSIVVIIGWQIFFVKPYQEELAEQEKNNPKSSQELTIPSASDNAKSNSATNTNNVDSTQNISDRISGNLEGTIKQYTSREDSLANKENRLTIKTPELVGSLNLKGARFDDILLSNYKDTLDGDGYVSMLSPQDTEEMYFADFGWVSSKKNISLPNSKTLWKTKDTLLSEAAPITLTWDNGQGLEFKRTISVDEHYMFKITDEVKNTTDQDIPLSSYGYIDRTRPDSMTFYISHEGPIGVFNEKLKEITFDNLKEKMKVTAQSHNGWTGVADKYWLTALIPDQSINNKFNYNYRLKNNMNRYSADFLSPTHNLQANSTLENVTHFFVGAKKVNLLDEYGANLKLKLFDRAVDFGWLYFLTKPMYMALTFFQGYVINFGLAILLMTIIVKAILFPLANKSYKSMAKMRKYSPELKELRDQYKDDKNRQNQEMMKFYQENKINPLSGCMPMLVQIPIFFALYKVLFVTIEMRHAPFYGWIKDLSIADPTNIFNLFGLFDFEPPIWLISVGVLPILFSLTMVIQQKLSPKPTDQTQAVIMKWMPIIFVFIFARFPAGLVLYWVWSNILSIIQQYFITRKIDEGSD